MNLANLQSAISANTASVSALSASVDAAVAALGNTTDQATIDNLTSQLIATNQALVDAKAKLDAAVTPPVPTP